ncbi:hypothetical protein B0H16DRAFT_1733323 [Mycena metata]|uniref:Uncharacterized protein n=1 Tax=Mycena metata TaxID=1033252 RepID=A0AAD7MTH4_9AGAR|nr:hypothetical protein B0H16DRAFT_1733323 [Mycena metata]
MPKVTCNPYRKDVNSEDYIAHTPAFSSGTFRNIPQARITPVPPSVATASSCIYSHRNRVLDPHSILRKNRLYARRASQPYHSHSHPASAFRPAFSSRMSHPASYIRLLARIGPAFSGAPPHASSIAAASSLHSHPVLYPVPSHPSNTSTSVSRRALLSCYLRTRIKAFYHDFIPQPILIYRKTLFTGLSRILQRYPRLPNYSLLSRYCHLGIRKRTKHFITTLSSPHPGLYLIRYFIPHHIMHFAMFFTHAPHILKHPYCSSTGILLTC